MKNKKNTKMSSNVMIVAQQNQKTQINKTKQTALLYQTKNKV